MNEFFNFFKNISPDGWINFFGSAIGVFGAYYVASRFYRKQIMDKPKTIYTLAEPQVNGLLIYAERTIKSDFIDSSLTSRKEYYGFFNEFYHELKQSLKPEQMSALAVDQTKKLLIDLETINFSVRMICGIDNSNEKHELEIHKEMIQDLIPKVRKQIHELDKTIFK